MSTSAQKYSKGSKTQKSASSTKSNTSTTPTKATDPTPPKPQPKVAVSDTNTLINRSSTVVNELRSNSTTKGPFGKITSDKTAQFGQTDNPTPKGNSKPRSLAEHLFAQEIFEAVAEVPPHIYKMLFGNGKQGGLAAEKIAGACTLEGDVLMLDLKGSSQPVEISFEKSQQPMMYFCPSVKQDGTNSTLDREEQSYSVLGLPALKAHLRAKMSESDLLAEMTSSKPSRASPPARQTMTIPKERQIDRTKLPSAKLSLSVQEKADKRQLLEGKDLKDEIFDMFAENGYRPISYKQICEKVDQPANLLNGVLEQIGIRKKEGPGTMVYLKEHFVKNGSTDTQQEDSIKSTKNTKR